MFPPRIIKIRTTRVCFNAQVTGEVSPMALGGWTLELQTLQPNLEPE